MAKIIPTILPILLTASVVCGAAEIAPDLDLSNPAQVQHVLVTYKIAPKAEHHRKAARLGARLHDDFGFIRTAHYSMSSQSIAELGQDPDVESIHPDREVHGSTDISRAATNVPTAWNAGYTGKGIVVAVIDSGLEANMVKQYGDTVPAFDFTGQGIHDDWGHGSHVAGIIAGSYDLSMVASGMPTNPTKDMSGIAHDAGLVSLKVLGKNGTGSDSNVIKALSWAVTNKSAYNIRVINLSLGRPITVSYTKDPLCQAVEQAWKAGIVVVVAAGNFGRNNYAGNQGYGTITAPGNDPYVITVGAMNTKGTASRSDDVMTSYSSKGPTLIDHIVKPDLVAPGNLIVSAAPVAAWDSGTGIFDAYTSTWVNTNDIWPNSNTTDTWFYKLSGTSMAAPMVSGAAAVLLQKTPGLTPDQVKARLMKTAYKSFPGSSVATDPTTGATYTSYYDAFTVGAGYLDVGAAITNTDVASGNALSPSAVYSNGKVTMQPAAGSTFSTGTSVAWGTSVIWGTTNVSSSSVIWGTSVAWGTSTTAGTSVIWGTGTTTSGSSVIWGTASPTILDGMVVLTTGDK